MRLIDADALKEYVKIFDIGCGCNDDHHERFLDAIDDAPTIEPDPCEDAISRKAAIDALEQKPHYYDGKDCVEQNYDDRMTIMKLPPAQPERDIPIKPIETTDKAWGIPSRQAVCPKCGYYLGHIAFLDSYKGKKITYCEACGQAIDWEGWVFDE